MASYQQPKTWDFHNPNSRAGQVFVKYARKVYHPLGFKKGYNFPLFVITCGALLGFSLARFSYLDIESYWTHAIPGETYWYFTSDVRRIGIIMHLSCVIPAIFLVIWQFVPIIRYKLIIFHRINGYICSILLLLANVSAFMIVRHAVGGTAETQAWTGLLGTMVTVGLFIAYYNIKRLQIDQHRAWMIRTWSWAACIITLRIIAHIAHPIINRWFTYYAGLNCAEIWHMWEFNAGLPPSQAPVARLYPQCSGAFPNVHVLASTRPIAPGVPAGPEASAVLWRTTFGTCGMIALALHVGLAELYLALTPAEHARLRKVSYERQVKAGYRRPELGALTASRLGDAPEGWNGGPISSSSPALRTDPVRLDSSETEVVKVNAEEEPKPPQSV